MSTGPFSPFRPATLLHAAGLLALAAGLTALPAAAQSGGNPADASWESPFGAPGMGTGAREAVVVGEELWVSDATYVIPGEGGGVGRAQLAVWNGSSWRTDGEGALPAGQGINDMAAVGSDIYIAGNFTSVGGVSAAYIARWDGSEWHALGDGVNGNVVSLASDGLGNLYVGGAFTMAGGQPANRIARWDGSAWSALPDAGTAVQGVSSGAVSAIAATDSIIYVGGGFTQAGSQTVKSVAGWRIATQEWESVGGGVFANFFQYGGVVDIAVAGDTVFVAGDFDWAVNDGGDVAVGNIAAFHGDAWHAVGNGSFTAVLSMGVSPGGRLFANGDFSDPATGRQEGVSEWTGSAWNPLNLDEYAYEVSDMVWYAGELVAVAGQYALTPGSRRTGGIGRWTGTEWRGLGLGLENFVHDIVEHDGALYAGGTFDGAGDTDVRSIARLDGDRWSVVGSAPPTWANLVPNIMALASTPDGLVMAGQFTGVGGITTVGVARWDGADWHAMGDGLTWFDQRFNLEYADGVLYAAGRFDRTGSTSIRGLARWTGATWEAVGGGAVPSDAIAVRGNEIIVGAIAENLAVDYGPTGLGTPTQIDNVAIWDGATWTGLGGGVGGIGNPGVYAIALQGSDIIVGGRFATAGATPANNIARWDGSTWITFGDGVNGRVLALHVNGNDVYVGGDFTEAGGIPVGGAARWDGASWHALGSGLLRTSLLGNSPASIATFAGTDDGLYVGGGFTLAGTTPSQNIARWSDYLHTGVSIESAAEVPSDWGVLSGNYPNPFSGSTRVRFELERQAEVSLRVYDVLGRVVRDVLDDVRLGEGEQEIEIDAASLPAGTYFFRLTVDGRAETGSLIVVR